MTVERFDDAAGSGRAEGAARRAVDELVRPGAPGAIALGVDADDRDLSPHRSSSACSSASSLARSRSWSSAARENGSRVTATSWLPSTTNGLSSGRALREAATRPAGERRVSRDADEVRPCAPRPTALRARSPGCHARAARRDGSRRDARCECRRGLQAARRAALRAPAGAASPPRSSRKRRRRRRAATSDQTRRASRHPRDEQRWTHYAPCDGGGPDGMRRRRVRRMARGDRRHRRCSSRSCTSGSCSETATSDRSSTSTARTAFRPRLDRRPSPLRQPPRSLLARLDSGRRPRSPGLRWHWR